LIDFLCFNATFNNITAISWLPVPVFSGGGSRREPPTMGKQLVNFITCKSSAPFLVIYKARETSDVRKKYLPIFLNIFIVTG
jgi:hypothetical protein